MNKRKKRDVVIVRAILCKYPPTRSNIDSKASIGSRVSQTTLTNNTNGMMNYSLAIQGALSFIAPPGIRGSAFSQELDQRYTQFLVLI